MDLSESDFIIPEDQKKQLDRIPGWVDEELSQAPPSQVASVNATLLPSVSQSVHKSPAKAPTEFYQGQPALQLAVDASIDSEEGDQEQMNIEKEVLGDDHPQQPSQGTADANKDAAPSLNDLSKVDDTFDEETQGPEDLVFQTQSLPMTLSTNDLAKSSEKPAEPNATNEPKAAETAASETPKKKKKKSDSKKKKAEKPASSDLEPAGDNASQKSSGDISKSNRSTRSKKKTVKSNSSASASNNNESADKAKETTTAEKPKEKSKSKKKSEKAKDGAKDKTKDKAKDKKEKTKDKTKTPKDKKTKDKTKDKKKKRKSSIESSGAVSSTNASSVAPEVPASQDAPTAVEQSEQPPASQPAVEKPAEVSTPTSTTGTTNAVTLIQETVVLHDQHVEADKDPNKIYDEQNRTIPNLNDDDMDSMMMSFHQELESASQLDLNAVPDYIVEASPDKSSYPIIRDLGSPLITSHTSSQAPSSQLGGLHFGHSNQEFSLGMPSDASTQARNATPGSQPVTEVGVNNNNMNNASEGSEDTAGKSSSSISQELISGTMGNTSPEKAQDETPAKEKHSLLEEMLMSDPVEANNITDSQADTNNDAEYFTQQPDLLGDSESQWEGTRVPATQGVVPVVPQSQGDLHSEFFSSSDDSGKDKQSQNANNKTPERNENNANVTPTTSPTSRKDNISPKARRHLEFNFDKNGPSSPTKSQPAPSSQQSSNNRFKFSLPKPSAVNPQKRINLSTQPQTQLPRVIATSPPKFKRPAAKSPPKENAAVPSSVNNNSPTKPAQRPQSSPEPEAVIEKEVDEQAVDEAIDNNSAELDDADLEITSEQRPRDESPPPLIRVNSSDLREEAESRHQRERSRSKSPVSRESKSKSREEKEDNKLKYVIDLEDLSPRFFNKTKKAMESNTNKTRSKERSGSGSGPSSQETTASPQNRTPIAVVKKTDKKSPSPNSRPGSLGDLIRQSRQQSLASKDPTMEFVIGYFKEVTSEPKPAPAVRVPKFASNTNNNSNGSNTNVGVKRKIDYYGWLDLTSNKKRKLDHNDNKKK